MNRFCIASILVVLLIASAMGDIILTVDFLDPGDPGGTGVPPNVTIVDFYVSVTPGDSWSAADVHDRPWNGTMIRTLACSEA